MSHDTHVLVANIAWVLIHFLWQGLLVAGLLYLALQMIPKRSSNARYTLHSLAMATMALAPVVTFFWLRTHGLKGLTLLETEVGPANSHVGATLASALPWIVGTWAVGAGLLCIRLLGGCWQVLRLRRGIPRTALSAHWQARFDRLAREFGVRAQACVVECADLAAPVMIGWLRPVVLLPARIFTGLTDDQIEALLAHELAHVARRDYLVNIVQSLVEALLFYHPAIWWVSQGLREEREYCCDDRAVDATKDGLSYARALTALETWRGAKPQLGVSTLGGSLMNRIQRLVGRNADTQQVARPMHALGTALVMSLMGATAFGFSNFTEPTHQSDGDCGCLHEKAPASVVLRAHEDNVYLQRAPAPDRSRSEIKELRMELEELQKLQLELKARLRQISREPLEEPHAEPHEEPRRSHQRTHFGILPTPRYELHRVTPETPPRLPQTKHEAHAPESSYRESRDLYLQRRVPGTLYRALESDSGPHETHSEHRFPEANKYRKHREHGSVRGFFEAPPKPEAPLKGHLYPHVSESAELLRADRAHLRSMDRSRAEVRAHQARLEAEAANVVLSGTRSGTLRKYLAPKAD